MQYFNRFAIWKNTLKINHTSCVSPSGLIYYLMKINIFLSSTYNNNFAIMK